MSQFALENNSNSSDITDALNYVLSNLGQVGLTADTGTGQILNPGNNQIVGYLYQYINVRYANSNDGISGFSASPTNKLYYGIRNSAVATASNNPADYIWNQVTGGFSTNKFLFYSATGGRQIQWFAGLTTPGSNHRQTIDSSSVDLDVATTISASTLITSTIYQRTTTTPATPTGGTFNFGNLFLSPPIGWYANVPTGSNAVYSSQNTFASNITSNIVSPAGSWTSPIIFTQNGVDAVSTYTIPAYTTAANIPITPTANTGSWNFGTTVGTAPNSTDGNTWVLSPPTVGGNLQLYASYAVASTIGHTGNITALTWSLPAVLAQAGAAGAPGTSTYLYQVFTSASSAPTTPTGGAYDFGISAGTPPAGWSNVPDAAIGSGPDIWVSTAKAVSPLPTGIWTASVGSWSLPVRYTGPGTVVLLTTYPRGQYITINPDGSYTPPYQVGGIPLYANIVSNRNNTYYGHANVAATFNPNTASWTSGIVGNTAGFTFDTAVTSNYTYSRGVTYTDGLGAAKDTVQMAGVQSGLTGNTGPQGNRGFLPMAYVVTPSDPTAYSDALLTASFTASRSSATAPIGTGYSPVNGDTAQFSYPFGTYGPNNVYKTFNAGVWTNVNGMVISGNVLVDGSLTATKLNANDLYVINTKSTNATLGNTSSPGYWLQANTGNARFGGDVSIGANLNVTGLITSGGLNANTVGTSQIQANAIQTYNIGANQIIANLIAGGAITTAKIATGAVTGNLVALGTLTGNLIASSTIQGSSIAPQTITGSLIAGQTITNSLIVPGTILATSIAASTITADKIAANSLTSGQIQANSIVATSLAAGTITADRLQANIMSSLDIVSMNGSLGSPTSAGYWMQANTGNARFAGNVSIGNNLYVQGLITAGSLNAGVITSDKIAPGVIPGQAGPGFNLGNVVVGPNADTWDGLTVSGYYYKTLGYVRIYPQPSWIAGTVIPKISIITSAVVSDPAYTSAAGYPQFQTMGFVPAYGGNVTIPTGNGYSFYQLAFSSLGVSATPTTYSYQTTFQSTGSSFWSNSYPSTFGIYLFGRGDAVTTNGTITINNIVCNIQVVT